MKRHQCPACNTDVPLWKHIGHSRRFGFPCSGCGANIRSQPTLGQLAIQWLCMPFCIYFFILGVERSKIFLILSIAMFMLIFFIKKSEKLELMFKQGRRL